MLGFDLACWARCGKRRGGGIGLGDPVVAPRRVIALRTDAEQRQRLQEISRSRTEPTSRVERARIILAYLQDASAYAVARTMGVTQQTVTRCLERAAELGVIEALDDRPRAGRDPVITGEAKTWLAAVSSRQGEGVGLSARTVDLPAVGRACPSSRAARRSSEPGETGPGDGLQDPGRAGRQAAQGALLPGKTRSGVRAQDGGNPLRLPSSGDAARPSCKWRQPEPRKQ